MLTILDSESLKRALAKANHLLLAGRHDSALQTYEHMIDAEIPLCRHRCYYMAAAHLGRAIVLIHQGQFQAADEAIRLASVIYINDGEQDLGLQVRALADYGDAALNQEDADAFYALWLVYEQAQFVWQEPEYQTLGMLALALMNVAETTLVHQMV